MCTSYRKMFTWNKSSTVGTSFTQTHWKLPGSDPLLFLRIRLNFSELFSPSAPFPCKCKARALKRHRLSLYGFLTFSSSVIQLTVWFFVSGSGSTASIHFIGTSLSSAAKTVSLLKFHSLFAHYFVHASITCVLLITFLISTKPSLVATNSDSSSKVLFLCWTDNSHLLHSWAQSQMRFSTLLYTWASRTLFLVFGSKCVQSVCPWQNWRLCLSHPPSQSPQQSACTFRILHLNSYRQSLPPTVSHPHVWSPIHFVRCAPSVYVISRKKAAKTWC